MRNERKNLILRKQLANETSIHSSSTTFLSINIF